MSIWNEDQVKRLNEWQNNRQFHPFTCPGDHPECENQRELVATKDGWVCQCGKYTQNWAHAFMMGDPNENL